MTLRVAGDEMLTSEELTAVTLLNVGESSSEKLVMSSYSKEVYCSCWRLELDLPGLPCGMCRSSSDAVDLNVSRSL